MHDLHTSLRNWPWFWVALLTPLLMAIAISTIIILNDNSIGQFCGTSACWTNFIAIFKIPIAIAGIAIPATGIAAAIHRSDETAVQIRHNQKQLDEVLSNNKFGNYLKHRESFIDLTLTHQERLLNGDSKAKINASALYEKVYPRNDYTHLDLYSNNEFQFWSIVHTRLNSLLECGRNFDPTSTSRDSFSSNIILQIKQAFDILELRLEDGWNICGLGIYSNIKCDLVRRPDLLSSLSTTIELLLNSANMLNTISNAGCEFGELHSAFDIEWKKSAHKNMYAAFNETRK